MGDQNQMKSRLLKIVGTALLVTSISVFSETSIRDYVTSRNNAVEAVHAKYSDQGSERLSRAADKAMQDVRIKLQRLVGAVNAKGFPRSGKSVIGSRSDDEYDGLDGVEVKSFDAKTLLFVTTVPIMESWLAVNRKDFKHYSTLRKMLGTEEFYNATATLNGDAAVYSYGEIPVAARGGDSIARAIVFAVGQDDPAPSPPDNLAVTVMQGDRIFIFTEKATVKGMPACSVSNQQTSITYEQCFAKKLPSQSEYPKLVNQAQRLVDLVSPQLQR
ncbi:hypothetical protein SB768_11105 [Burkholderia sp. SIMBA_043]|uniref:hypothetical protein n=1 Tax=Burkholderia TaxID=32008 RepID=UPI000ACD79F5|nr:hypothetical protein [Burkholderia vietnamiensis]UBI24059.1 hypothetical protein LA325_09470 [Burkholderia vietnamiensis]